MLGTCSRTSVTTSGPTRDLELDVLAELEDQLGRPAIVAGMDEVGRGALAGPVGVGVALVTADSGEPPAGLNDSKKLSLARRTGLVEPVTRWAEAVGIGYGSVELINSSGIVAGLRHAGLAALAQVPVQPDLVLLDGVHDWLTGTDLFDSRATPQVRTVPKGDASSSVIAAASIIAKVARDELMVRLDEECLGYSWSSNKGYASPAHVEALTRLGPCRHHRTAWHLPGAIHE